MNSIVNPTGETELTNEKSLKYVHLHGRRPEAVSATQRHPMRHLSARGSRTVPKFDAWLGNTRAINPSTCRLTSIAVHHNYYVVTKSVIPATVNRINDKVCDS